MFKHFCINIIMRIITFVFIFSAIYTVSFAQSAQPSIFCHYGGSYSKKLSNSNYVFSIDDVPTFCDVIGYGGTYFNSQPDPEDTKAITELKSAGKTVYALFVNEEIKWPSIISSTDATVLDNFVAPMITYLNENKVDGVILTNLRLLTGEIDDYTNKINGFLCKIKESVPNLKIGILVFSPDQTNYGDKGLFDFTVINSLVDIYFIDTTLINVCDQSTIAANGGRLPLTPTSSSDTRFTLEQVCTNMNSSGMDINKLYVALNDGATKEIPDGNGLFTYSEYCAGTATKSDMWCLDSMQQFYDTAIYAKKYFKGMIIYMVDSDDYDNSCCCGLFPVANAYVDGWKDQPLKSCDKIG